MSLLLDLLNLDEMAHSMHHATNLWAIFFDDHISDPLKAKGAKSLALLWSTADL
jgi:hypothetical protein